MEALVNFQTMVTDLTAMDIANASMLDEATAAAEAMTLAMRTVKSKSKVFVVSRACHPQTIEVIQTRAQPLGIEVLVPQSADAFTAALNAAMPRKAMRSRPPSSWPLTCWPSPCSSPQAKWVPTSWWAPRSALACPWAQVARTPPTWLAATNTSALCQVVWWA
jgi:glycine dehydrogenase